MIEIHTKLAAGSGTAQAQLKLPFDLRQKSRLRTKLADGEDAWLLMPRGDILRGGDLLQAGDGRIIVVVAEPEEVLHITCASATALTRAAYHLGNRHVPVQVGEGFLRITADHVLAEMLKGLGAVLTSMRAPFEPEAGAYGGAGGHHHGDDGGHSGRIHEYIKSV